MVVQDDDAAFRPRLLASSRCADTGNAPNQSPESKPTVTAESAFFKSAQWTADGHCIITSTENDNQLRTYVLPDDIFTATSPRLIEPAHTKRSSGPIRACAVHPFHNKHDESTTRVLYSTSDLPIYLENSLKQETLASYRLIHSQTEGYVCPTSLLFTHGGTRFVTGSESLLAVFDVSRDGLDGPIAQMPTIPSRRKKLVGGGVGIKGIVSALGVSSEGVLAAGMYTRCVGLYGNEGQGDTLSVFSVASNERFGGEDICGNGITQCLWSPCGRYLYVVERKSDGALMYDVRVLGKQLGVIKGRNANTNQRIGVEIIASNTGDADSGGAHALWGGGTDGMVRTWTKPYQKEGVVSPDGGFTAHEDVVSSAVIHPQTFLLATCSGSRHIPNTWNDPSEDTSNDTSQAEELPKHSKARNGKETVDHDFSLKVWGW